MPNRGAIDWQHIDPFCFFLSFVRLFIYIIYVRQLENIEELKLNIRAEITATCNQDVQKYVANKID